MPSCLGLLPSGLLIFGLFGLFRFYTQPDYQASYGLDRYALSVSCVSAYIAATFVQHSGLAPAHPTMLSDLGAVYFVSILSFICLAVAIDVMSYFWCGSPPSWKTTLRQVDGRPIRLNLLHLVLILFWLVAIPSLLRLGTVKLDAGRLDSRPVLALIYSLLGSRECSAPLAWLFSLPIGAICWLGVYCILHMVRNSLKTKFH